MTLNKNDKLDVSRAVSTAGPEASPNRSGDKSGAWKRLNSWIDGLPKSSQPPAEEQPVVPVGVDVGDKDCLTTRARELLEDEYRKRGIGTDLVNDAGTATSVAISAIVTALAQQHSACPKCGGTGEADSGGIMPWGAPAMTLCECQQPAAVDEVISAARAVAKEYDGPLEAIIYDSDDDEAGDRVCCRVRSYEPHAEGCPLIRLRAALAAQPGGSDNDR